MLCCTEIVPLKYGIGQYLIRMKMGNGKGTLLTETRVAFIYVTQYFNV